MPLIYSLDTETTGLDIRHGARPFFVTTSTPEGEQVWWEWPVDPLTRRVLVNEDDIQEIRELLQRADTLVLQNAKFDYLALESIGISLPWHKVEDTLIASHLLASGMRHDLTSLGIQYLGVDIQRFEDTMERAVKECRRLCQAKKGQHKDWLIAREGLLIDGGQAMPSASKTVWKFDTWLPRAMAEAHNEPPDHYWRSVTRDYANADSLVTAQLWPVMWSEIRRRGLQDHYSLRMRLPEIFCRVEDYGMTGSVTRLQEQEAEYREASADCLMTCQHIAEEYKVACPECVAAADDQDHDPNPRRTHDRSKKVQGDLFGCGTCGGEKEIPYPLYMPRTGNNDSLRELLFTHMGLPTVKETESGGASLDKGAVEKYLSILPTRSKERAFLQALSDKRKRDTALTYMQGYRRFYFEFKEGWFRLHPVINLTGTATLRKSSSNPNEQNISKREGFNLRYLFGPALGREWWSCDAQNIELRIPAYEAGEKAMIALFEEPDAPPFYGSNHLLNFSIIYPELWEKALPYQMEKDGYVKKTFPEYGWVKNAGFAKQYGGQAATVDAAAHREGAYALLESRFRGMASLNRKQIRHAQEYGYVETIPSRFINPERGYPIQCARTEYGKVLPTVPLNYHVQGTACEWMCVANVRVDEALQEWNKKVPSGYLQEKGYFIIADVHDEMVFDFPKRADPRVDPRNSNLGRIKEVCKLMALGGDDLVVRVPTPVACEFHPDNWSEGVRL